MVEFVFVKCGPSGFDFCTSLHLSAFSLDRGLGKVRGMEVEMGLEALTNVGRIARMICLERGIVGSLARKFTLASRVYLEIEVTSTLLEVGYTVSCP